MKNQQYNFRDIGKLVKCVKLLLVIYMAISFIIFCSDLLERHLLLDFQKGDVYMTDEEIDQAAEANDNRQMILAIIYLVVFIVSTIAAGRWINLSNKNARALGAAGMEFSPAWAVGWYFIPVFALWKPYRAMKEIYKASKNPADWQAQRVPGFFPMWWFLWILSNILGQASYKLTTRAKETEDFLFANMVDIAAFAIDIPLCIVFLVIVTKIWELQKKSANMVKIPE